MSRQALVICLVTAAAAVPDALAGTSPKKAIRVADQALAQSIVVKRADLPAGTWKSSRSPSGSTTPDCPGMKIDLSDLTATGDANAFDFQNSQTFTFVSSGAGVLQTAEQARTWYSRFVRPQIARCFGDAFKAGLGKDAKAALVSAGRVPFPHVTQDVAVYRVVGAASLGGQRLRMYLDLAIFHHGRGDAVVLALGLGKPFAPFRSLATVVARRMAHA